MEKILKSKGLKSFILKMVLFVVIGISISLFIYLYFNHTQFSKTHLTIPKEFIIEAPNSKTTIINAIFFGFVALIIISYKKMLKIKYSSFDKKQIIFIILTIIVLFLKYYYAYLLNIYSDFFLQMPLFWGIVKITFIILFVLFLGLSIFSLNFVKNFIKDFKKEIIISLIISLGFYSLMFIVQNLWSYFSSIISNILYHIFSLFFDNVTYKPFVTSFTMAEGGGPLLGINNFKAIVGKPCSGIDSFLLFTSLYTLIFILDYKKLKKGLAIVLFFVGAIGMFLTNLMRILLLFIVGAYIDAKFAVGMFHSNIGWILFIIYFFIFWWIASKYVYKEKRKKNEK